MVYADVVDDSVSLIKVTICFDNASGFVYF